MEQYKIGDPFMGFKFESGVFIFGAGQKNLAYNSDMNKFIGKIGKITDIQKYSVEVIFNGRGWIYPINQRGLLEDNDYYVLCRDYGSQKEGQILQIDYVHRDRNKVYYKNLTNGVYSWMRKERFLEVTKKYIEPTEKSNDNLKIKTMEKKNINIVKTQVVQFKEQKLKRKITLYINVDTFGNVEAGYSVLAPGDKFKKDLAEKIAEGRAVNARTNLFYNSNEPTLGEHFRTKYMLHKIADKLFLDIERGHIKIKGIR